MILAAPSSADVGQPSEDEAPALVDETPTLWFVELASPPAVEDGSATTLKAEKTGFRANAKKAGLGFSEGYTFDTLFNGLSIRINKADLSKLTRIEGVKAI